MAAQRFVISGRLPGYNQLQGRNWQETARIKREAKNTVIAAARWGRLKPVKHYPCRVYITCWEPDMRRDDGNVKAGASKVILDALQEMGVLAGDGRKYVRSYDMPVELDRGNPRIVVEIREDE